MCQMEQQVEGGQHTQEQSLMISGTILQGLLIEMVIWQLILMGQLEHPQMFQITLME